MSGQVFIATLMVIKMVIWITKKSLNKRRLDDFRSLIHQWIEAIYTAIAQGFR